MREGDFLWGWIWPPWWMTRPNFRAVKAGLAVTIFVLAILTTTPVHGVPPTPVSGHDANTGLTTTLALPFAGDLSGNQGNAKASFMAKGFYWLFYGSGSCSYLGATEICLLFSTSSDGITWSAPTNTTFATGGTGSLPNFNLDTNGTTIFLSTITSQSVNPSTDRALFFRYGSLGAGTINWSAVSTVVNDTGGVIPLDLKLSSKNVVFLSFQTNSNGFTKITHSSDLSTWTTDIIEGHGAQYQLAKVSSPAGAMYAAAIEPNSRIVNGTFWNDGWQNETVYTESGSSAVRLPGAIYGDSSGNVYLFVRDAGTLNLIYAVRNTAGVWGNSVIASTSTSQSYAVSYAPNLSTFAVLIFQSSQWLWFTISVTSTSSFVVSPIQTLAMTGSFTVSSNGITNDFLFSVAPNQLFSPAGGLADVSDFYWTEGSVSPYTINSAQMLLTPGGGSCFFSSAGCNSPGQSQQALPLTAVVVQLFASLFFSSVSGEILLGFIVFILVVGVYGYAKRQRPRRERTTTFHAGDRVKDRKKRISLDKPVKPRKKPFKI